MKTKVLVGLVVIVAIAAALAVKLLFFPSIKDGYFAMNERSLQQVPSGIAVVRPTHFPKTWRNGVMYTSVKIFGKQIWRTMGRDVSLEELMGVAYGKNADRVALPPGVPKTNYDFLVTSRGDLRQALQSAIRKKLGYVAHTEMRDQDVLAIKIQDASLPGLVVSDDNSKPNVKFDKGRLYFTHMKLKEITGGLEEALKKPVVDRSDLTNFYDFSLEWNPKMEAQLQNETNAPAIIEKILGTWGLGLEPDSDRIEMLVVRDAG